MKNTFSPINLAALGVLLVTAIAAASASPKPNIIFIMSDDVGYGDIGCYGAQHVKTPNLDRLAREGLRFTDAHTTASVCTPTRFALLTGQYAWRQKGTGIAAGDTPALIRPGTPTLASMLKSAGYHNGLVGKWHLGLGDPPRTDFNSDIKPGPLEIGFDYAFYIPATGDRVPCVFVENHRVVGLDPNDPIRVSYGQKIGDEPTGRDPGVKLKVKGDNQHSDTVINGIPRIGFMTGGKTARWVDEDIADVLTSKAVKFIEDNRARPFFLFLATHDIHEPMIPHPRFRGTSDCGWRGDVIHQLDWTVGEVLKTLDRLNLAATRSSSSPATTAARSKAPTTTAQIRCTNASRRTETCVGGNPPYTKAAIACRSSPAGLRKFRRAESPTSCSPRWTCSVRSPRSLEASSPQRLRRTVSTCCPRCWASQAQKAGRNLCCKTVRIRWRCGRVISF
jgi:hypothetical protein